MNVQIKVLQNENAVLLLIVVEVSVLKYNFIVNLFFSSFFTKKHKYSEFESADPFIFYTSLHNSFIKASNYLWLGRT